MSDRVAISLVQGHSHGGVALVFDIDDIRILRNLGIAGILAGTLPSATQQNAFLSVPLRLMTEEALWLVEKGAAYFVTGPESVTSAANAVTPQDMLQTRQKLELSFAEQREFKQQEHVEKLRQLGLPSDDGQSPTTKSLLLESSLFIETPNSSALVPNQPQDPARQKLLWKQLRDACKNQGDYHVYKALRQQEYFLSPGARFGGRFIAYPGDPLRYHSHMTVQPALDYSRDSLDLLQVVSGGRLGTGVKKLWVVAGVKPEAEDPSEQVSFFSIEWAAFG
ncbi:LANO_0F07184g1_1 [Lachancea nothofagi CBS 11611]|uniref:tRNA-splicing endonuclease subunit Sen34 n=1 Tax=Lachancea nothofagi CBS 11611 TaxID=1266666 RepID=A0A1G4K8U3_9SACH|nr:LANO_0F07184g1_1 [Lachancea nothofagi CBS 11611]